MSYNPYQQNGPYYPPYPQAGQYMGTPYPIQSTPTQYPQYQYPSPIGQQPGYGGWPQPGYGGMQQPGYGGMQQPSYGGMQQPGYSGSTSGRVPSVPNDVEYRSRKRK
jgi:hypothetical protein